MRRAEYKVNRRGIEVQSRYMHTVSTARVLQRDAAPRKAIVSEVPRECAAMAPAIELVM